MKTPRGLLSILALVAANVYPLVGVLYWKWDPSVVLLLYWAENLILGFYNILKMATATNDPDANDAPEPAGGPVPSIDLNGRDVQVDPHSKAGMIGFFCLHYGMFCFGHGLFLFLLIAGLRGGSKPDLDFSIFPRLFRQLVIPTACLLVSHGISFIENYVLGGERRRATLLKLLWQPYGRMAILHIAILGGMFFVVKSGDGLAGMVAVLVVLKIIVDIVLHVRSHHRLS